MSGEKNKLKTLAEIVAELRMGDDGGKPAYRIGRRDRVEISMPSREKIRSLVIEEVHISELADWIEEAEKREKAQHGNAAAMREALIWMKERWTHGTQSTTRQRRGRKEKRGDIRGV